MNLLQAIILGIVQGLTEFLPISSTAHLTLTGKFFGLITAETSGAWTAFIAVMQLGTLAAVLAYFYRDVVQMAVCLWKDLAAHGIMKGIKEYSTPSKLGLYIVAGTVPIAIVGLLFRDFIEGMFTKSTTVIACSLIGLALLLWIAEKVATHSKSIDRISLSDALLIGIAQVMALIPGSSRSGTTLTAGLFLNLRREAAARFSFLLSIPAVAASGLLQLPKVYGGASGFGALNLAVATIVSAIVGYAAIAWLLKFLSTNTTFSFVLYRVALGLFLFALLYFGAMEF